MKNIIKIFALLALFIATIKLFANPKDDANASKISGKQASEVSRLSPRARSWFDSMKPSVPGTKVSMSGNKVANQQVNQVDAQLSHTRLSIKDLKAAMAAEKANTPSFFQKLLRGF